MIDSIRARASLLFLGVVFFLLLLGQIPRWDSGWVQAVGSIAAIISGFAYIALQNRWQRNDRIARERAMRRHVQEVGVSCVEEMERRVRDFNQAAYDGRKLASHTFRDALDILGDELVAVSPTDCNSADISTKAREIGLHAKAFAHRASELTNLDGPAPLTEVATLDGFADTSRSALHQMIACARSLGDGD